MKSQDNIMRIDWIDIAKGIAILLVIIGHTVPYDSATRNVIYSFHMPLFFLLSGYTYRFSDTYAEFKVQAKKVFKRLIFPVFYVSLIILVFQIILYSHGEFSVIVKYIFESIKALYYSSGIPFKGHPSLGALWFLISLFWAKIIIDIVHINFKGKNEDYIYIALGLLGIALGIKGRWLAQNLDGTLVSILYIYIGILWKKYNEWIDKRELIMFIIATLIWTYFLSVHMYLEMAVRSYPGILLSSLEAICGTFLFAVFVKALR